MLWCARWMPFSARQACHLAEAAGTSPPPPTTPPRRSAPRPNTIKNPRLSEPAAAAVMTTLPTLWPLSAKRRLRRKSPAAAAPRPRWWATTRRRRPPARPGCSRPSRWLGRSRFEYQVCVRCSVISFFVLLYDCTVKKVYHFTVLGFLLTKLSLAGNNLINFLPGRVCLVTSRPGRV